jgi:hypothetical protein
VVDEALRLSIPARRVAPIGVPPERAGISPTVYRRRWWILVALCLSLLIIFGQHEPQRRHPTLSRGSTPRSRRRSG